MIKLFNGDCLDIIPLISKIDMVLSDPPYGTTQCRWDSVIPLKEMWKHLKRVTHKNSAIVLTSAQPFTTQLISSNLDMFKQALVWSKNKASGHLNANRRHLTKHEDIILFSDKSVIFNKQKTVGHKPANYAKRASKSDCYGESKQAKYLGGNTDRCPTTIIEIPVINNDSSSEIRLHPTQKPLALMEYLIKTYTNEGDTILDFAMGSGTTGVACLNTNRNFIGIEKDKEYFEIAEKRING